MARHKPQKLFGSPQEMIDKIDEYFESCEKDNTKFASLSGLCLFLGFTNRSEISLYKNKYKGFKEAAEYAILKVEELYERRAIELKNPTGPLYVLKTLGWESEIKNTEININNANGTAAKAVSKKVTVKIVR